MKSDCLAELSGVRKRFGNLVALDNLDMQVHEGELLAVLGPNGAGKTTAISLLLGLEQPDAGRAELFGRPPIDIKARRSVGVMMQEVALAPELRVREHVDLVASYYPVPLSADYALEVTNSTSLAQRPYGKLSGGQKRQAQFAMAVCGRPRLLFLDEPTVGLDVQARESMWTALRQFVGLGGSIVLTTHYLEEAEALADRVVILIRGRVIASGTVADMRALIVHKHISCITTLTTEQVARWSGVEAVSRDDHRLHVTTADVETVVRRLLGADGSLSELEVRQAGLSDAFIELTQEKSL